MLKKGAVETSDVKMKQNLKTKKKIEWGENQHRPNTDMEIRTIFGYVHPRHIFVPEENLFLILPRIKINKNRK